MEKEMVTIIIPVYNVRDYVKDCINSVCNQTYKNIQIIIVNDGSTDGVEPILQEYEQEDSRVQVIHKKNGGLSSARNTGLDNAIGEYISFIDSDDLIPSNFIENLISVLSQNSVDIAVCGIQRFFDEDPTKRYPFMPLKQGLYDSESYISKILLHKVDNSAWNKIYRRNLISDSRFTEGIINEDFPFIMELLNKTKNIYYTHSTYYEYRIREGSITATINPKIFDFVQNGINLINKIPRQYHSDLKGYICYESVNCIAKMIIGAKKNEYSILYKKCNNIIKKYCFEFFFNKCNGTKQIAKYFLCILFPNLFMYLRKHKP